MIVIDLGYRKVVMPKEKAMQLMDCLESAELYEEKYWSEDKRKELGAGTEIRFLIAWTKPSITPRMGLKK